jgi:hypothetical protein
MSTVVGLTADATVALVEAAKARSVHTGTQPASTISDLTEVSQDLVAAMVVAGTNITANYNDAAGTLTIASTASGINEGIALSAYTNGAGSAAANTTAIQNAINAAIAATKPLINDLGAITVQINARINILANGFIGRFNGLRLQQTTANTAGVRLGGLLQHIDGLTVYCSTNPGSGATNANAFEFTNCAFSKFSNLLAENSCRGFYMPQSAPAIGDPATNTVFSCVFENININGWALSAIDFQTWVPGTAASTGNVWNNIYLHNNFFGSTAASAAEAIIMRAFNENVFNQLNMEWCTYTTNMTFFQECNNLLLNSVHFEGNTLTGADIAMIRGYFATRIVVNAVTGVNNTIGNVVGQRSIFKNYGVSGIDSSFDVTSVSWFDTVNAGARPFALMAVESGATNGDYEFRKVDIQDFVGGVIVDPTGVVPSQVSRYNDVSLRNFVAPNITIDKVKTSDTTVTNTTTKTTDATLQFPTTPGTYIIEGMLAYRGPAACDLRLQYNCTGTITRSVFHTGGISTAATTSQTNSGNYESTAVNADGAWGTVDGFDVTLHFRGTLVVSTAGTFAIQFAQFVANATGIILRAGSSISYRKL